MRHVAALAGVGVKTVSRVINGEPNVSAATIARVNAAARTLDYQPDLHAGNLRRADGRTRTLGLLVGSVDNPFAGAVHRAVEDAALAHGVAVFASSLDDDPDREQEAVAAFLRRRVDGLILTTVSEQPGLPRPRAPARHPRGLRRPRARGHHVRRRRQRQRRRCRASPLATCSSTGTAGSPTSATGPCIQTARERRRGFLEELGRAGVATRDVPVIEGPARRGDRRAPRRSRLFDSPNPPTAVFSSQNLVTIGVIRALRELGRHRDTALVGFDDVPLGRPARPRRHRGRPGPAAHRTHRRRARLRPPRRRPLARGAHDRADPTDRARLRRDPAARGKADPMTQRDSIAETASPSSATRSSTSCATSTAPASSSAAPRSTWPSASRCSTRTSRSSRCSATTSPPPASAPTCATTACGSSRARRRTARRARSPIAPTASPATSSTRRRSGAASASTTRREGRSTRPTWSS